MCKFIFDFFKSTSIKIVFQLYGKETLPRYDKKLHSFYIYKYIGRSKINVDTISEESTWSLLTDGNGYTTFIEREENVENRSIKFTLPSRTGTCEYKKRYSKKGNTKKEGGSFKMT